MVVDVSEDELSFPSGISSDNNTVASIDDILYTLKLFECGRIRLVAFLVLLSDGFWDQQEWIWKDRQRGFIKASYTIIFGHSQRHQMA
ncbi:hypothetical protein D3C71_2060000 [compost metagenome]